MIEWFTRILLVVICMLVAVLILTSLPTWQHDPMLGQRLMLHMMMGSGLIFTVPLFGVLSISRVIHPQRSTRLQRIGFWMLMLTAMVVIASVLLCMMPLLGTEQMHQTMSIHGYAGLATVPALLALGIGAAQWRRMKAMRSTTPG